MTPEEKFAEYEKLGERRVRFNIATLTWSGTEAELAKSWLQFRNWAERDAREEKTLSVAEEANRLAEDANKFAARAERWAMYAAIAAVIAAAISAISKTS